jgi:hypothetical protein
VLRVTSLRPWRFTVANHRYELDLLVYLMERGLPVLRAPNVDTCSSSTWSVLGRCLRTLANGGPWVERWPRSIGWQRSSARHRDSN